MARSLTRELGGRNITANVITPGFIETDMTAALDEKVVEGYRERIPAARLGQAEDVAGAALFLAGAGYVSGAVIPVDGGLGNGSLRKPRSIYMGILEGKNILVTGVTMDTSIAYRVAEIAQAEGAKVVVSNLGRRRTDAARRRAARDRSARAGTRRHRSPNTSRRCPGSS